jgi:ribosome biogenesis GTPase
VVRSGIDVSLIGVVRASGGGSYRIRLESGEEVEAVLRGRLKRSSRAEDRVVIGDRVRVAVKDDGSATVEEVFPRRTIIARRTLGGRRPKVVAANLDRLLVVIAARSPDPNLRTVDRFLVTAEAGGLEGVLVINKLDLPGAEDAASRLAWMYEAVGYPVHQVSAVTRVGLDELREVLCEGSSALVGPSGAGKSTILNALDPELQLRTGELSRKVDRGRHTTAASRLIDLRCGGEVADTPGFSDVGIWASDAETLEECFPEFRPHLGRCRFRGCTHEHEPDCAVKEAVELGEILPSRYESYRTLMEEARAIAPEPGG